MNVGRARIIFNIDPSSIFLLLCESRVTLLNKGIRFNPPVLLHLLAINYNMLNASVEICKQAAKSVVL